MKPLTFNSSYKAQTSFGSYHIEKDHDSQKVYLVYPDGTSKKGSDINTLKIIAEMHYLRTVLDCLEQPLVTLFSAPTRWRTTHFKLDRLISRGEIYTNKFSLNEAIAFCYQNQREVLSILQEEVGQVCVYNNLGWNKVHELVVRMCL